MCMRRALIATFVNILLHAYSRAAAVTVVVTFGSTVFFCYSSHSGINMMPGTPFKQLIQDAMDCVVEYGVLIKAKARSTQHCAVVQAVPIALWPSVFPQKHYEFLIQVQMDYNILLNKLSSNELLVDSLQWLVSPFHGPVRGSGGSRIGFYDFTVTAVIFSDLFNI